MSEIGMFRNKLTGTYHPVEEFPENPEDLVEGKRYLIGNYVYHHIGSISTLSDLKPGVICILNDKEHIQYIQEDSQEALLYSADNIIPMSEYDSVMDNTTDLEKLLEEYCIEFEKGNNLTLQTVNNITVSGDVFMPEFKPDDDPFEKVVKSMLHHLKVVLNSKKGTVEKGHVIDNLRSALNGATKNMSITKFLLWNKVLATTWDIHVWDASDDIKQEHCLKDEIWLSSDRDIDKEIEPTTDKSIFVVPLEKEDDPLKKLIKLVLDEMRINPKDYESKSNSAHLINNLKSALKSKQKMTLLYFITWCELLDIAYSIKMTDPNTGVYFQVIGYDVYTNLESVDPMVPQEEE